VRAGLWEADFRALITSVGAGTIARALLLVLALLAVQVSKISAAECECESRRTIVCAKPTMVKEIAGALKYFLKKKHPGRLLSFSFHKKQAFLS
jgi:hypothetical protein